MGIVVGSGATPSVGSAACGGMAFTGTLIGDGPGIGITVGNTVVPPSGTKPKRSPRSDVPSVPVMTTSRRTPWEETGPHVGSVLGSNRRAAGSTLIATDAADGPASV